MRIFDLNVNGFKAFLDKGGAELIENFNPDIVCLQETRTNRAEKIGQSYKYRFHNKAQRKGYAGTMVYSKVKPLRDLTEEYDFSNEGRLLVLEYNNFILVNVYVPSSLRNPDRFSYRLEFNNRFIDVIKNLDNIKPVLICGDFNCARSNLDMDVRAKEYEANEFLVNERDILVDLEELGFYDPVRKLYRSRKGIFSWRSPKNDNNSGSQGRRLDYCYLSRYFPKDIVTEVSYLPDTNVSDHYPMIVDFKSIDNLKEDFLLRKEWELIDLKEARKTRDSLIEAAKRAFSSGKRKNYQSLIKRMADSKEIKALAVEKALKAKTNPNIHQMNWHYTNNKMKALNSIDLEHHKMDPVHFFEIEEKGKTRFIGKLSNKDYAAHYMVAQILKPYHDLECDTHSYAYIKDRSHIDLHNLLYSYLTQNNDLNYIAILDVKSFFDSLDHDWLCRHIPIPSKYLKNILETENVIFGKKIPSEGKGISMGSPAAAYLANITLNGIEDYVIQSIKSLYGNNCEIYLLRFSDDIVILTEDRQKAEAAQRLAKQFLSSRKLSVNEEKCTLVNFRKESFVLMNWEYKFYRNNLYVEPTAERIEFMKRDLIEILTEAKSQTSLIKRLNEKISGWGSDLRYCDSTYIFWDIDKFIEDTLLEKTDQAHRFLDSEILRNRYFININGRLHFCLPKDKTSQLKKLAATPLVKEQGIDKDVDDSTLQMKRINERYRGIWRRQEEKCAICGERILPNEERNLVRINGTDSYIHKECNGIKVNQNKVIFDLTTPEQIERAIEMKEPFLESDYIFPGLVSEEDEKRRRMLHQQNSEVVNVTPKKFKNGKSNYYFNKSLRLEGYLPVRTGNRIIARKQQEKTGLLRLPEWLSDVLSQDDLLVLKNFMSFLKDYYKL